MKQHGGQSIVDVLQKEGVKKIFGVPGESYLNVLDAIYEQEQIEFISTRQEGGASFMAEGYAKATGDVGVCMATRGPGATNLSIGIHTAQQDSTPLVALIGQVERPFKYREAFQEVNYLSFFDDLCKWVVEIDDVKRIPELLHRAFHIARSGRPGPVVVSLPEDMQDDFIEEVLYEPIKLGAVLPDENLVKDISQQLSEAKKPVIIAGGGVILSNGTDNLVELSEKLDIPVVTAFRRFHAFPNDHPNYIGTLGIGARESLLEYIYNSDLVLALGTKFSQMTTADYTLLNKESKLIHVDISPDVIGRVYNSSTPVVADVNAFLESLLSVVNAEEQADRAELVKSVNKDYVEFSTINESEQAEFAEMKSILNYIQKELPTDTIITSDAGNFFSWISRYYRFIEEGMYLGPTSGAMGYGMPSAIGAKLAHPDRHVFSFSGDGGYMMTLQEFETAVRYNVPIIAVVVNNNLYGTIHAHQERKFPNRSIAIDLTNPDFTELAKNFGGHGEKVTNNDDIAGAIQRAIEAKGPALIEVITNPEILSASHEASLEK
ncbi:MAG TPA: thiamine pyrophosphate-dependent enzyme [Pseudogracilibacillus sp.]|nr:thiamine pyrophosphate-dependent enzyme [Pseudogracilibacillus sp.]